MTVRKRGQRFRGKDAIERACSWEDRGREESVLWRPRRQSFSSYLSLEGEKRREGQQKVPDEKPQSAGRRTRHKDHQDGAISEGGEVMKASGLK